MVLIQLTRKVITLGYGHINDVKEVPNELRDLVNELVSLEEVLNSLQDNINKNPQSSSLETLNNEDGPLRECTLDLKGLESRLKPRAGLKGLWRSLKWSLKEKEILKYTSQIKRQRILFTYFLTASHM